MEGLEDGQIPAPLPLLRRSHANAPVVYKSAFGEPLQPVIHRDSAATERFWNAVVVHSSQCLPLGTPVCPECVRNTQSSEVTAASSPSRAPTSAVRRGAKLALIPTLAPPAPGAISGGEHIFDQELSYELHKLWEMFENSPCEECGEVVAVPNLDDDSWDNSAKGCLTWTGSSRFTVYVHDYGKAEVNIGTVPSTELYISTCAAVRVPAQYLLPVVSLPYPLTPGTITQWRSLSGPAASSAPLSTDFFRPRAAILAAQAAHSVASVDVFHPGVATCVMDSLIFNSTFECGNLKRVDRLISRLCPHKVREEQSFCKRTGVNTRVDQEYDLWLREDLSTKGNIQWFYFSVTGAPAGLTVRFNLVNHNKQDSLFNYGLLPCVYSDIDASTASVGWRRAGYNSCYFRSCSGKVSKKKKKKGGPPQPVLKHYFIASFTYVFRNAGDTVYFAYCQPYTASHLSRFLLSLERDGRISEFYRRRQFCETLAGNPCDVITVTAPSDDPEELASRRGVFVSARVHPGETNSSWMMQGFLRFITGFSPEAQLLRSQLVIKIIPMLNPDGVVSGNYRCSLAGTDLNRRYDNPSRYLFPTIHATKALLSRFAAQRKVMLYCDIHGHSRRFNTFIYGCSPPGTPPLDAARCRVYPHLLFKDSPADVPALPLRGSSTVLSTMSRPRPASASLPSRPKPGALTSNTNQRVTEAMEPVRGRFSFLDCSFVVQDSKRATGRVIAWEEFGIANSFTLEASFCGSGNNDLIDKRLKEMTARRRIGYKPFTTVGSSRASLPAPVPTVPSIPSSPDIPPREIVLSSAAATPLVSDAEDFVAPVIDTEHLDDSDSESGEDGTASPQSLAVSRLVRAKRDAMPSAPEPDDDEDESQFLISSMKRHAQPDGISSDAAVDVAATSVAAPVRDSFGLLSERAVDIPITGDGPASQHSTLRHYSTLDLELQGVSMGVCLVPLVGLWSPALAIPATPVASPSPQPTSARQRTPLSSRRRPQSAIKRVGSSSASPGTPAADSPFFGASTVPPLGAGYVPDILKEVMQDMETYGMGRDDESGSESNPSDDNLAVSELKSNPLLQKLRVGMKPPREKKAKSAVKPARKSKKGKSKPAEPAVVSSPVAVETRPPSAARVRPKSGHMTHTAASLSRMGALVHTVAAPAEAPKARKAPVARSPQLDPVAVTGSPMDVDALEECSPASSARPSRSSSVQHAGSRGEVRSARMVTRETAHARVVGKSPAKSNSAAIRSSPLISQNYTPISSPVASPITRPRAAVPIFTIDGPVEAKRPPAYAVSPSTFGSMRGGYGAPLTLPDDDMDGSISGHSLFRARTHAVDSELPPLSVQTTRPPAALDSVRLHHLQRGSPVASSPSSWITRMPPDLMVSPSNAPVVNVVEEPLTDTPRDPVLRLPRVSSVASTGSVMSTGSPPRESSRGRSSDRESSPSPLRPSPVPKHTPSTARGDVSSLSRIASYGGNDFFVELRPQPTGVPGSLVSHTVGTVHKSRSSTHF